MVELIPGGRSARIGGRTIESVQSGGQALRKLAALLVVSVISVATAIGLASCGSSSSDSGGKEGGTLIGTFAGFPDYLDPALSYTQEGWTAMYDTYIPLLTYAHESNEAGSKVIPGLATGMPKITNGGKTYTLMLQKGLKYSDGTPIKASDFRFAVERMIELNSGGSPFYTESIVGAEQFQKTKQGADFRDQDERPDRGNRHQPDRTARDLHQRARADVRRAASPRHPDQEPFRRPATGERALRDRQLRPGPGLEIRPEPRMAGKQREAAARPPERPCRQDRHQDHPQHLDPGQRSRTGHHPVDAGPDPTRASTRRPSASSKGPSCARSPGSPTSTTSG